MEKRDCIIIGAGIAGMTAAIYLKRFAIDVLLLEKEIPGGQLNKTKNLKNYPGFLDNDGAKLAENIYSQIKELNVDYRNENVIEVSLNDKKIVKTSAGEYECNQVIIATGRAPRLLKAKNEEKFLGQGISYCAVCDGFFFKGRDVAVIGGSATALENALYLSNLVNKCYIICRRDFLKGEDLVIESIKKLDNVEIIYNANVKEFKGNDTLEQLLLEQNGQEVELDVTGAFISIGYEPNYVVNSKVDLKNDGGYLEVDGNCQTNIEGVFAVGDAIKKDLYQLTTAVGEASIASNYIKKNWYK